MKKVVAYCRVSTDSDDQKNSLENQRLFFEDYIKNNKGMKLTKIYADEGISGTSLRNRVEFGKMMEDAKKQKFDIILTKEVCRFARNTVDTLEKTRDLKRVGVEVKFIIDNISTMDTDGELRLTIMAGLAQDESRRISERVQFGVLQSMKKGVAFGNIVYGYDFDKGKLIVNEEEAKVVRLIFQKYTIEGKGVHTIAKELKEMGIKVKRTGTTNWGNSTLLGMLKNVKYIGHLKQRVTYTVDYLEHKKRFNKGEVNFIINENNHEPIVDLELFNKTQEVLKERSVRAELSKYSNKYALSNKIVCAECGKGYTGVVPKKRKDGTRGDYRRWRCSTATNYGKMHETENGIVGCNNVSVDERVLQLTFLDILKSLYYDKKRVIQDIELLMKKSIINDNFDEDKKKEYEKEKEKAEREKDKILDLCIKEIISEDDYVRKTTDINKKIDYINTSIEKYNNKTKIKKSVNTQIDEIKKVVTNVLKFEKFSDKICEKMLDKIIVHNSTKFDFYLKGYNKETDIENAKCVVPSAQH